MPTSSPGASGSAPIPPISHFISSLSRACRQPSPSPPASSFPFPNSNPTGRSLPLSYPSPPSHNLTSDQYLGLTFPRKKALRSGWRGVRVGTQTS
ncbi:hypothetical protein N656DRAFT_774882 [Canariomyces notabilis]|uniref:Uncharacterized protein n=1 Tax=Canariomyces notabilis TaxID=2074819 RepID=A0AAN6TM37_9PEZI|nr:hypothetical protein N656DRAFT_774882 [Canariomyces arenarius]